MDKGFIIKNLKELSSDFLSLVKENEKENLDKYIFKIEQEVYPLLNIEKPKIMLCGIYNAGKSTLINALCREEIASVADRPETAIINEYDKGDYILIDSPGIDAPIEHEKITKDNISKCHVIFFVISNKGSFESKKNYEEMYQIIKTGKPVTIVINDKLGLDENENEIRNIKNKIIYNLQKVSNDAKLSEKYDIVVVNAKRALKGVIEDKKVLYKKSNLELLENKIQRILQKNNALTMLNTPIYNLINILNEFEEHQVLRQNNFSGEDYKLKIKSINLKRKNLINTMNLEISNIVYGYEQNLINACIEKKQNLIQIINSEMENRINELYKAKVGTLNSYAKKDFSDLNINLENINSQDMDYSEENININSEKYDYKDDYKFENKFHTSKIHNFSPKIESENLIEYLIKKIFEKGKREEEEYKRELEKIESENEQKQKIAIENLRIRQEIRSDVQNKLEIYKNRKINEMISIVGKKFDNLILIINENINKNNAEYNKIKNTLNEIQILKLKLDEIKGYIY